MPVAGFVHGSSPADPLFGLPVLAQLPVVNRGYTWILRVHTPVAG